MINHFSWELPPGLVHRNDLCPFGESRLELGVLGHLGAWVPCHYVILDNIVEKRVTLVGHEMLN